MKTPRCLYSATFKMYYPFQHIFPEMELRTCKTVSALPTDGDCGDILLIWGGGDVHPSLYGKENEGSYVGCTVSERDQLESALLMRAIERKMFVIGICRGAQLACAAAGGILIQDVGGHGRSHPIQTDEGKTILSSSLHHQMLYPWNVEHNMLAVSAPSRSRHYIGITDKELENVPRHPNGTLVEPEVLFFPTITTFAIQGHPEFMEHKSEFNVYIAEQARQLHELHTSR